MFSNSDFSFITNLESDLYNAIQEIRNDKPPLVIRKDLYSAAVQHAQNCVKKVHHNVKEGFESRRMLFKECKRYMEINFVTKPLTSDPISFISYILKEHYISRIQSQINSIGPAIMKLKSNKYVVVILGAFYTPIFSVRLFFEYFPEIREMKDPSTDFDILLNLINHFREMHNYHPLVNRSPQIKEKSHKKILSKTVTYESKKANDLFCRLFTDQTFIDLIGDIWTDFTYSFNKGESNSLLKMIFYREDEEYVYTVDVMHPINKNQVNNLYAKPTISKRNDKNNNLPYIIQDDTIIEKQNEPKQNDLANDIEDAIRLLNNDIDFIDDDMKIERQKEIENEDQLTLPASKRSPFENYEPTDSKPNLFPSYLSSLDKPQAIADQKRNNSTSSLLIPTTINKIITTKSIPRKLSPAKSAWGNLKPKLNQPQSSLKPTEDEEKQNRENMKNEENARDNENSLEKDQNNLNERNLDLPEKQGESESNNQDDVFDSDSSDAFVLQPKTRSNSAIISSSQIRKSPWSGASMTPSDDPYNEKHELLKIPSKLRKHQVKHPEVPAPSKMIARPLSARSSMKGWSKIKMVLDGLPPQQPSDQIIIQNPPNEIQHPQKKIINHASNAWSLINPDVNQNIQDNKQNSDDKIDNLDDDEVKAHELSLSPIAKVEDKKSDDQLQSEKSDNLFSNFDSTESNEESDDTVHSPSSTKNSLIKKPSTTLLKKSHKAVISPLGQSLKKTSLKTLKKKQPIKTIPSKDKSTI